MLSVSSWRISHKSSAIKKIILLMISYKNLTMQSSSFGSVEVVAAEIKIGHRLGVEIDGI